MQTSRLLILALAVPLLCRCMGGNRIREIGGTRMLYESPSLSRAETTPRNRIAFKGEAGEKFHPAFTGNTDAFERKGTVVKPRSPGNLDVEQGDQSVLLSAAFRFSEAGEVFLQGELSWVAGTNASAWLLGCRSEMNPGAFSPFLEGGFGLLDVYAGSVIDEYREGADIFFPSEDREYLGSDTIDASPFVLFPHVGAGIRAPLGSRLNVLAKARTLFLRDVHGIGIDAFMNGAGMEADLAVSRHFSVHVAAEIMANTLPGSRPSQNVGLGFTYRP